MEQQFEELYDAAVREAHSDESAVKLIVRDERDNIIVTSWQASVMDGVRLAAHQMAAMAEEKNLAGYVLMGRVGTCWETMILAQAGHPGRCYLITPIDSITDTDFDAATVAQIDDAAPSCIDDKGALTFFMNILGGLLIERKELHKRLVKANLWKGQAK